MILSHKNNLSYFNNEYEQNNLLNTLKSFNKENNREKKNSDLMYKNFIFKGYNNGDIIKKKH